MKVIKKARAAMVASVVVFMLSGAAFAVDKKAAVDDVVTLACEFPDVNKPFVGHIHEMKSTFRICSTCDAPYEGVKWKIYKSMLYYAISKDRSMSTEIQQSDGKAVLKLYNDQGKLAVESHGLCNKVH